MTTSLLAASPARSPTLLLSGRRRLPAGWPLSCVLCLFPIWWALGLAAFAFILAAIPMTYELVRTRPVRVPPGFAIWLVFLFWVVGCNAMLGVNPPGTVPSTIAHRLIPTSVRLLEYLAATVTLLYVGNLPAGVTQRRLLRWLSVLCFVAIGGGMLGMLAPHFQFTSPIEILLPGHVRSNGYVQSLVHPAAAQLQQVLGYVSGRPAAPFGYTNTWGNCLSILLVWFIAAEARSHRRRTVLVVVIAAVPIVYSLNRGMWIGLMGLVVYLAVRNALLGRGRALALTFVGALAVTVLFLLTPLHSVVVSRLHHGASNDIREFTTAQTIRYAERSPLVGYGTTRVLLGSSSSITVGRTVECPRCGNPSLGENGEIWSVLVSDGFVGAALYLAFFLYGAARFWRDRSAVGIAGVGVLLLAVGYSFVYNAAGMPLYLYMISYALLWQNARSRRPRAAASANQTLAIA